MERFEYLNQYEEILHKNIVSACKSGGYIDDELMLSPDIEDKWDDLAPYYVADAVKEIANYPMVALGWAMYLGMAVAKFWDEDWSHYSAVENMYLMVRDVRGFDYMDEVVRGEILGLEGDSFDRMENLVRMCSQQALDAIRHEQIEPQSQLAFHVYARSVKVLYQMGAMIWLHNMGYKMEPYSAN